MKNLRFIWQSNLLFIAFSFGLMAGCSSSVDSLENVPTRVLLSSSEGLLIEGRQIKLNANLNRDFAPSSPANGWPLIVKVEIVASNGKNLPSGFDTDAVWVIVDGEAWGSSYSDEQFKEDKSRIVKIARDGPKFGVGKKAEVIVRIHHNDNAYLLRASGQEIEQTM